ncbi:MAG TPA: hypothetical protein H9985_06880 [Candidatus Anaerofilum faecale]|nr:hypothetical protein [Anaerofilum sp. An201]HIX13315.1 hypothetical protein [Candidatus Anaerofilum faecale]
MKQAAGLFARDAAKKFHRKQAAGSAQYHFFAGGNCAILKKTAADPDGKNREV